MKGRESGTGSRASAKRRASRSSYSLFPGQYSRKTAGFTLLEMLAVILLIGIAAAAVAVSVTQGLASARVSAASGELAAAMRAVRTQAIVHGNEHTFDVNTRDNTYRGDKGEWVRLPSGMRIGMTSAKEDQVNSYTGRIRFFPDGSSTGGHVTLQREQRQWRVNVSWLTGAVSVADASAKR